MYVHVYQVRRDFQKQKTNRMPSDHQQTTIRFAQRVLQAAVLNVPAVQKQILPLFLVVAT